MQKKKIPNQEETYKTREEFGIKLKEARLQARLSEQDVIHLTRISPPFIKALETGDFDKLPGKVFAKGFVKSICQIIRQNPDTFLELFERCWEDTSIEANHATIFKNTPRKNFFQFFQQKEKKNANHNWFYIGVTGFIALFICLWFFSHPKNPEPGQNTAQIETDSKKIETTEPKKEEVPPPTPEVKKEEAKAPEVKKAGENPILAVTTSLQTPLEVKATQPVIAAPIPAAKETPKKEEARASTQETPKTTQEGDTLVLRVLNDVEIRTKIDTGKSEIKKYSAGEYSLKFKDNIDLYIMDISLIEIDYNGQKLTHLGPAGTERKLSFSTQEDAKKVF